jgi:hypothetical protein
VKFFQLLLAGLLAIAPACAQNDPASGVATGFVYSWAPGVYAVVTLPCSSTVTSNCDQGGTLIIQDPTSTVTIPACAPGVASTAAAPCIGPGASSYTWQPNAGRPSLAYALYVAKYTQNMIDASGATIASAAVTTSTAYEAESRFTGRARSKSGTPPGAPTAVPTPTNFSVHLQGE